MSVSTLTIRLGVRCEGVTGPALKLERSQAFRNAFHQEVTQVLGSSVNILAAAAHGGDPAPTWTAAIPFEPDGYVDETVLQGILGSRIRSESPHVAKGGSVEIQASTFSCCRQTKSGWQSCSGYALHKDGQPWTTQDIATAAFGAGTPEAQALGDLPILVFVDWESE